MTNHEPKNRQHGFETTFSIGLSSSQIKLPRFKEARLISSATYTVVTMSFMDYNIINRYYLSEQESKKGECNDEYIYIL